jgi:hypothetical protein
VVYTAVVISTVNTINNTSLKGPIDIPPYAVNGIRGEKTFFVLFTRAGSLASDYVEDPPEGYHYKR